VGKRKAIEIESPVPWARAYKYGGYTVVVGRESGAWTMVIAHPRMYAPWDVVAEARSEFVPGGVTMAVIVPTESELAGNHSHSLHLHEIRESKVS
jgi:hypothetical protein